MLLQAANLLFKALLSRYSGYLLLITTLHQKPHFLTLLCSSFFTWLRFLLTRIGIHRNKKWISTQKHSVGAIMNIYQIMSCLNCRAELLNINISLSIQYQLFWIPSYQYQYPYQLFQRGLININIFSIIWNFTYQFQYQYQ